MTAPAPREGARRALHVLSGALGVAAIVLPRRAATLGLAGILVLALVLETSRFASPGARAAVARVAGGLFRPAESGRVSAATMLAFAYLLTWLLFAPALAARAITVTAVADPAAAVVGRRWGRGRPKSLPGSAAAFAAALVALLAWHTTPFAATLGALAAALAERVPVAGADNLAVPLTTALALRVA